MNSVALMCRAILWVLFALVLAPEPVSSQEFVPAPGPARVVTLEGHRERFDRAGEPATVRYIYIDVTSDDWNGDGVADHEPLAPKAIIVVFAGGDGTANLNPTGREFGTTTFPFGAFPRYAMAEAGFVVALVAPGLDFFDHQHDQVVVGNPSNPRYYLDSHWRGLRGHTLPGQPHADLWRADMEVIFSDLRERFPALPLWVLGHSNGTTNGISAAVSMVAGAEGLVLASPGVFVHPFNGISAADMSRVSVPVLVLSNRDDTCNRGASVDAYVARLRGAPEVEVVYFSGGEVRAPPPNDPCEVPQHYFGSLESEVIETLTAWVSARIGSR